jgi:plastocyanin domain-containing protein
MVVALALFNISNGFNLTGITLPTFNNSAKVNANTTNASDPNVTFENGIQVMRMNQSYNGYSPNTFTVQKGIPVKWVVNSQDAYSCAASIFSPQLGIKKILSEGENIIEFTPNQLGKVKFTCSMGMFTGIINVVDSVNIGKTGDESSCKLQDTVNTSETVTGCAIGENTLVPVVEREDVEGDNSETQLLKATYTLSEDIQPNNFTVKANVSVKLEVLAKDSGYGCMGSIALPGLSKEYYNLQQGQKAVFNFTPTKIGTYKIACAMGVPRGTITVQ